MTRYMIAGQFPGGPVPLTYSTTTTQLRKRWDEVEAANPGLHLELFCSDVGGPVLWEVDGDRNVLQRVDLELWRQCGDRERHNLLHPTRSRLAAEAAGKDSRSDGR